MREGKLVEHGHLSDRSRTKTYTIPVRDRRSPWPTQGPRVRFTRSNLGASEADDLTRYTHDVYVSGDEGVVAFEHPNPKTCPEWVYVEVDARHGVSRKLYVGVHISMIEAVP